MTRDLSEIFCKDCLPCIPHQPWLNFLLTGFVSSTIEIFRNTVSSARPKLERSVQLELACLSTIQQGNLTLKSPRHRQVNEFKNHLLPCMVVQVTSSVCSFQRPLKSDQTSKLPQVCSRLSQLLQTCR